MLCPEYMLPPIIPDDDENLNGVRTLGDRKRGSSAAKTRSTILVDLSNRLSGLITSRNEVFNKVASYTDLYNSWMHGVYSFTEETRTLQHVDGEGRRIWSVFRKLSFLSSDGTLVFRSHQHGQVLKLVLENCHRELLSQVFVPDAQADSAPSKESVQGDATQSSDQDSNTIITRDQQQTVSESGPVPERSVIGVASSEPTQNFSALVGRWMPLSKIVVMVDNPRDTLLASYYLPEVVLTDQAKCAPNTVPFESFVYGHYHFAMKFVVNANKFHCGKVVVSVKFDSYQSDDVNSGFQAHLSRKHVILDLSANNEGTLDIPFRYHRAFVRNQTHATASKAVRPGKYATVYVSILSPLRTGAAGANDIDIRPFYMIKEAHFAGMSYKVALTQMDIVGDLASALPTKSLKSLISGVEQSLDQLGKSVNQDKPTRVDALIVVPRPRLHFPSGKGISDASPLRMNPTALTSFKDIKGYSDDPKTTLDIARIWGLRSSFVWSATGVEGSELFNSVLDPMSRSYSSTYDGQPTPLEYVCSFYQFWSGPIELRFDFVSNSFHTGAVIISAEFNRTSDDTDECQSHSTYTKTFHLGDQKSVDFRVPYIYDTVMRRSTTLPFCPVFTVASSDAIRVSAVAVRPEAKMRVKVRVLNALRPVASAPQEIDVLVFMRAAPTFALHGLCQSNFMDSRDIVPIDSFPSDAYLATSKSKRSTPTGPYTEDDIAQGKHIPASRRYLPATVRNKWNEYRADKLGQSGSAWVQMDSGAKEDMDSTDNFAVGVSSFGVQSVDSQVGIKDILRRPTLLLNNTSTDASVTGFFIPLMPPSRMFQYKPDEPSKETAFNSLLGMTPQAAIMNLFRFWRGAMRYTIIVHKASGTPVYVTHIPHAGTRLFGNLTTNGTANGKVPIYGSGLSTEIIIPVVNPTLCVEVPFDSENNWALTFDEDAQRNYSWRDKGDQTSGQLVISSLEPIKFSVFWSAADDFEVANFYGIPRCISRQWDYELSDEHARVQMDPNDVVDEGEPTYHYGSGFRTSNVSTAVGALWRGVKEAGRVVTPKRVVDTAICAIPYVGPAYTTARVLDGAGEVINVVKERVDTTATKLDVTMDKVANAFGTTMDNLAAMIQKTVDQLVSGASIMANLASHIYDVILDVLIAWIDKSWTAIGVGIIRFMGKALGCQAVSGLLSYATQIGEVLEQRMQPQLPNAQAPPRTPSDESTLVGILGGLVGTLLNVQINRLKYASFSWGILDRLTSSSGVSYLCGVLRFVQSVFDLLKSMILEALGYVSPEAQALKLLSGASPILERFVTDAQMVTSEANASMVHDPNFRTLFWKTVLQAYQIQRVLTTVPTSHASPILGRLCADVIKAGNDKYVDISASPVRYEPFVICLEGPPGIGKSEVTEALVDKMLDAIGLPMRGAENVYYRMPASKYWSGFRSQKAIVYDDWANITDPVSMTQQLMELYQLKSTAIFVPEMAHLEEKKTRGNPLIVVLVCNSAFPRSSVSSCVHTPEAVFRRRDLVLKVTKSPQFEGVHPRDMSEEEQIHFSHLNFQKYADATNSQSLLPTKVDFETSAEYIAGKFRKWHEQEKVKVRRRMNKIQGMFGAMDIDQLRLEDPFELFYSVNNNVADLEDYNQNAFLPSEILAAEVKRISEAIGAYQRAEQPPVVVEEPTNPFDVAEAQMDWGTFGLVLSGMASSRFCLKTILGTSKVILGKWVNALMPENERAECPVCYQQNPIYYRCNAGHPVCKSCMDRAEELDAPIDTCPTCRSEDFSEWRDEQKFAAMTVYWRWALYAGLGTLDMIKGLRRLLGGGFAFVITTVLRFSSVFVLHYGFGVSLCKLADYVFVGNVVDNIDVIIHLMIAAWPLRNMPIFQNDPFGDAEETGESSRQVVPSPMSMFDPVVEREKIDDIHLVRNNHPVCLHHFLKNHAHHATYKSGIFKILDGTHSVDVPEELCVSGCAFSTADELYSWYSEYVEFHRPALTNHLLGFAQAPRLRRLHMESVPRVLRPAWMLMDPHIDNEIRFIRQSTSWWDYLPSSWSGYIALISALAGVAYVVKSLVGMWSVFGQPAVQAVEYDQGQTRHLRQTTRALQREPGRSYFQAEQETPSLESVVKKYVASNYITLELTKEGQSRKLLNGVGLYNRVALLPRHYVRFVANLIQDGYICRVGQSLFPHTLHFYTYSPSDFVESPTTDLALFYLPASFGMFKDIRKFFCTDDDLTHNINSCGSILVPPGSRNPVLKDQPIIINRVKPSQTIINVDGTAMEINDVLAYDFSLPGACGSLVFLDRSQRPLVAMHVAGMQGGITSEGYGVVVTKESLMLEDKPVVSQMDDFQGVSLEQANMVIPESNVVYLGALPPDQRVFIPRKSKIRPSMIQGKNGLVPLTEPCILDKTDSRYSFDETPLSAGVKKHGRLTKDFPTRKLEEVESAMWDMLFAKLRPAVVQPYRFSPEEACIGIPGMDYYDPIILNTSAGFPYVCGGEKTKGDYIQFERDELERPIKAHIDDRVWKVMLEKEELRKRGIVPITPFIDTLKDERRKPPKVRSFGGTRVFCNPPVDFVIQSRQNYLHLCAASMKYRFEQKHAVGINIHGEEWTILARRLLDKGNNICTLDYENFGPGFNAGVAERVLNLFKKWTLLNVEGVDEMELASINCELNYSVHICSNTVYYQKAGSPSGAPITTIINTYVNLFYIFLAWLYLVAPSLKGREETVWEIFCDAVEIFAYGDDVIMSVSDEFINIFNSKTISDFLSEFNIVSTDASKSSQIVPFTQLSEASFLKCNFRVHDRFPELFLSQLDWTSVNDCTQWVWECADYRLATYENCKMALLLAHGHGPFRFQQFKDQINYALSRVGIKTLVLSWEEIDSTYFPERYI
uniref:Genome polyprotein n=1 Tax=Bundaberg bee virus 5 TaxID=2201288 RepID=A0A2U8JQ95_9VIRU|nr:polyprotein [Bundaberg bee virus 5]